MTPQRFFFIHMMKTAGVSLRERLVKHFGGPAVYPYEVDGNDPVLLYLSVDLLLERLAVRGDEIRVITGHFPRCSLDLIGGEWTTFTLLREPVERTLSYLRFQRDYARADSHKTLDEIYDDPMRFHCVVHNHMTKMLSLTPSEMTFGMLTHVEFTPDHLERAKEALGTIDVVGFQEDFDEFCDELSDRFGWDLGEPESANISTPADVPDGLRERIAEDNALDVELYEFAKELVADRSAGAAR